MKNRILVLFIALLALTFTSCISEDKVKMVGVNDFVMVDEDRFNVFVQMENLNGSNLTVKSAYIALLEDQTELVNLSLGEKVIIPRRSNQELLFPLRMRLSSPEVLSALPEKTRENRNLTVQGKVTGKWGIFSKTYKIGPMPLEEFLSQLDSANRKLIQGWIY